MRFKLQPILDECYLEEVGVTDTSVYTVNGIATVSVNSGTEPGPVRVEVSTDCDLDGSVDLEANAVPLIIEAGPPRYIYTDWNPQNTQTPGGGLYQTQLSAIVKDRYHNPVEDSTYVYWTIDPVLPDTIIEAEVELSQIVIKPTITDEEKERVKSKLQTVRGRILKGEDLVVEDVLQLNKSQIIPELLQSKCNPKDIYDTVDKLLSDKQALEKQVTNFQGIISKFKTEKSSEIASKVLLNHL